MKKYKLYLVLEEADDESDKYQNIEEVLITGFHDVFTAYKQLRLAEKVLNSAMQKPTQEDQNA
ncbi:MAG: hypothetical protein KC421_20575 [Anaerolineales bacterium]|nr:hypothetical protein [Anaerolineales bacterium]